MAKQITPSTKLYAIFGKPVSHSISPLIHNMLLNEFGIDAVYLAFEISDIKKGVEAIRTLGIKGASITIPFKEDIIKYLDEIDDTAIKIGAVNTVINKNGHLWGCNTDCDGATKPLKEAAGSLKGKQVYIIGAGGAARAVAFGVKKELGKLIIVNRSKDKGQSLAKEVEAEFLPLELFNGSTHLSSSRDRDYPIDIIINTTSVGMNPNIDESPVNPAIFNKNMVVMDIVYNPLKTKMLKDAQNSGCKIVDGLSMFIYQGAAQFELFTGIKAPHQLMRDIALTQLMR
ncbi:MAG: shikimate dehydrogenase [Desulfamplus sp.]|nr:shikimate dehydrogenase [Desulfamplus sp.]